MQAIGGGSSALADPASLVLSGNRIYVTGSASPNTTFGGLSFVNQAVTYVCFLASHTDATLIATTAPVLTAASLTLFPNPAHGRATVQVPAVPGATTATLTLLDAPGRTLRTQTAATNAKAELDLAGLAPGLYAVRVQAGGSTATRRLVVE